MALTSLHDFEFVEASTIAEALALLTRYNGRAKLIAGGVDTLLLMKAGAIKPGVLVGISSIQELKYIKHDSGKGLSIGAATKLSEIASSEVILRHYPILARAAIRISTPHIRNMGTIAGNILQEVWCWYLRNGFECWKSGGRGCPAATGQNTTYFSVMGGQFCIAACSSDTAPALLALDATATIEGPSGKRLLSIDKLLPGTKIENGIVRSNAIRDNEILTKIDIPERNGKTLWAYERFSFRHSWDFPLVSIAASATSSGKGSVKQCRIAMGGVAPWPHRAKEAERIVESSGIKAAPEAANAAVKESRALGMNAYKVEIAEALLERAILNLRPI